MNIPVGRPLGSGLQSLQGTVPESCTDIQEGAHPAGILLLSLWWDGPWGLTQWNGTHGLAYGLAR